MYQGAGYEGWCLIFPDLGIDDSNLDGIFHHCHQVIDAQFFHDIGTMFFHGFRTHAENIGDLVRGIAFNQQPEDLLFPLGEKVIAADSGFFPSTL